MSKFKSNIRVVLEGGKIITLRQEHYLASGGEASIYRLRQMIIKLYTDSQKMQKNAMEEKIRLLSKLNHPYIVSPKGLVYSEQGKTIGYYMDYVEGEAFSRVFTNAFWQRENFSTEKVSVLVEKMRELVSYVHIHGFRMVDPNEMNWLLVIAKNGEPEPRILDVDSWANDRWPASVIMPSVRDWHGQIGMELADWFAWGVVSFQLYTGIHPYKGALAGYKMGELEKRMKANASVFSPGVRLNRAVRSFSEIPPVLLQWYEQTFQKGKRSLPPSAFDQLAYASPLPALAYNVTTASGSLRFDKIFSALGDPVQKVFFSGAVLLKSGRVMDSVSQRQIFQAYSPNVQVLKLNSHWFKADYLKGELLFSYLDESHGQEKVLDFHIKKGLYLTYENRFFVLSEGLLSELSLQFLSKAILSVKNSWRLMENALQKYSTLLIQDVMGAKYLLLPFDESAFLQLRLRELDRLRIVQAKYGRRFVALTVLDKQGQYHAVEISLSRDGQTYSYKESLVDSPDLNLAILPKMVAARIVEDGALEILVPSQMLLKRVEDKGISSLMQLSNIGDKVVYISEGELYSLRMA